MTQSSKKLSCNNLLNGYGRELRPRSLGFHCVLTATVTKNPDLFALGFSDDLTRHLDALYFTLFHAKLSVVFQHDHLTELDRIAGITFETVHGNDVTLGDFILFSTGLNHSVHKFLPKNPPWLKKGPEELK